VCGGFGLIKKQEKSGVSGKNVPTEWLKWTCHQGDFISIKPKIPARSWRKPDWRNRGYF
jgi:NADH:ubiquinone oxidoreductase subunit